MKPLRKINQKGIALVTALLISVAIMAMAAGVLYLVTQATSMSGTAKRYATAQEAADGTVDLVRDSVNQIFWGGSIASVIPDTCFTNAVLGAAATCQENFNIPGTTGTYNAQITIARLFSSSLPGGRIEFARAGGGAQSTAIFFRITVQVTGPNNEMAENSILYRFTG